MTTASTIPTPMVYAMNLKSQDVKMLTHVTTTQMQQTMTVRARMPKKVTIVMEFASVTQTVTAYATSSKLQDVQMPLRATMRHQLPMTTDLVNSLMNVAYAEVKASQRVHAIAKETDLKPATTAMADA